MDKELVRLERGRVRRAASIHSRSYVLPSSATTCSCMSEWWIGQQSCSGSVGCHAFQFSMSVSVCCLICCKGLFYLNLGIPVSPQLTLLLLLCCPRFANLCLQLLSIGFAKLLTVFSPRLLGHGRPFFLALPEASCFFLSSGIARGLFSFVLTSSSKLKTW